MCVHAPISLYIHTLLNVRTHARIHTQQLNLSYNAITHIQGLGNLRALQTLNLADNGITAISGIDHLANLKTLVRTHV
jgi:Leucine-rich repeat (LRR) protein